MLAMLTKTQEWALDASEAMMLAEATANVSRHYDVQIAAKTTDWISLMMVCGTVYGSRLAAIRYRKREERAANPTSPAAPVKKSNAEIVEEFSGKVPDDFQPGGVWPQ